jgi:Na+-transporting NADH:ubiquinone oxidoreductase subunit NqrC
MSKKTQVTQAALDELDAKLALARQDARHEAASESIRMLTEELIADERQRLALERLEAAAQAQEHAAKVNTTASGSGFWREAVQGRAQADQGQPVEVDPSMSLDEYIAWRRQDGAVMDGLGIEQTGRTGKHLGTESGLPDWRSMSSGSRVYESQLTRSRGKAVPPGYQRSAATEEPWA